MHAQCSWLYTCIATLASRLARRPCRPGPSIGARFIPSRRKSETQRQQQRHRATARLTHDTRLIHAARLEARTLSCFDPLVSLTASSDPIILSSSAPSPASAPLHPAWLSSGCRLRLHNPPIKPSHPLDTGHFHPTSASRPPTRASRMNRHYHFIIFLIFWVKSHLKDHLKDYFLYILFYIAWLLCALLGEQTWPPGSLGLPAHFAQGPSLRFCIASPLVLRESYDSMHTTFA